MLLIKKNYNDLWKKLNGSPPPLNILEVNMNNLIEKCNSNGEAFILDQEKHDKLKAEFERDYKPYLPTLADFVKQQKGGI